MLFIGILWGFRGCATDRIAFCDTKCVSGENFGSEKETKFSEHGKICGSKMDRSKRGAGDEKLFPKTG